jgi:antitoxin MazE
MTATVRKWGNSLGLRIPKQLADELGMKEGTAVRIVRRAGRVEIVPVGPKYSLKSLLRGVRPSNIHVETDWGSPVGKEVW